ncbi:MAG: hypothetical protein OS130_01215 [Thermodesulfobacteriota bacterium]|nr:MAG: hypothetical protein OS130_01215 [Thermodesulfobacteriota bacterium]
MQYKVLFHNGKPIPAPKITNAITEFNPSYDRTVRTIIEGSNILTEETFKKNAATLLPNFKMTRAKKSPLFGIKNKNGQVNDPENKLLHCWDSAKEELLFVKSLLINKRIEPRTRALLLLDEETKKQIIHLLWNAFKKLLPITMGKNSYGLVGASKILFSVIPEIVLAIDNAEWLKVFQTVDLGDVINLMANEIKKWEEVTEKYLDHCDSKRELTLPAVYNVMAMNARP